MSDFNVPCKFSKGTKVKVVSGFLKGEEARVKYVHVNYKPRGLFAKEFDSLMDEPSYTLSRSLFKSDIYVYESQIEEIGK